jgi:hypothetical protein
MTERDLLSVACWAFILAVPINGYIVWHGWTLNASVTPRSPMLRALLWTKFSVWVLNLYLAVIGYRFLNGVDPVLPFGGVGLALMFLFLLAAPLVIHSQMRNFIADELDRHTTRDLGRDEGRDPVRDDARDIARDAEHDAGP